LKIASKHKVEKEIYQTNPLSSGNQLKTANRDNSAASDKGVNNSILKLKSRNRCNENLQAPESSQGRRQ